LLKKIGCFETGKMGMRPTGVSHLLHEVIIDLTKQAQNQAIIEYFGNLIALFTFEDGNRNHFA